MALRKVHQLTDSLTLRKFTPSLHWVALAVPCHRRRTPLCHRPRLNNFAASILARPWRGSAPSSWRATMLRIWGRSRCAC